MERTAQILREELARSIRFCNRYIETDTRLELRAAISYWQGQKDAYENVIAHLDLIEQHHPGTTR